MNEKETYFVAVKLFLEDAQGRLFIFKDRFGDWDLPGGRIKPHEFDTPLPEVLKRKMAEELGPNVCYSVGKPEIFMRHQRVEAMEGSPTVRIFALGYVGKLLEGEPQPNTQHPEILWVDKETFQPEKYFKGGWLKGVQEYIALKW